MTYLLVDLSQLDGPTQRGVKVVGTMKVVNFAPALWGHVLGRVRTPDMNRLQRQHFRKIPLGLWWCDGMKSFLVRNHFPHYYCHHLGSDPYHRCCYCCCVWRCSQKVLTVTWIYWTVGSHLMILCARMVVCVLCGGKLDFNYSYGYSCSCHINL